MKRIIAGIAIILLAVISILLTLSPDVLSMAIIGAMAVMVALGFVAGLLPLILYASGFREAVRSMEDTLDVQATETWLAVFNLDRLFKNKYLDGIYIEYRNRVQQQKEDDDIIDDIEMFINEDTIALKTWHSLLAQIPGSLTGLGILGTFLGLLSGIDFINFASVEGAIESISTLLSGVSTAFYTSIAGVIFSIIFNILFRIIWNYCLREYGVFINTFHKLVIPSYSEQENRIRRDYMRKVIARLDRIPRQDAFSMSGGGAQKAAPGNEQILMPQIIEGLKKKEFIFYLQPNVDLKSKRVIASEALIRWNHYSLGLLSPSVFVPVLEANGFITRVDSYIWEQVFEKMRHWIDKGTRPVPISLNLSKTDLMALDVGEFMEKMLKKYHIPPRLIEMEIAKSCFTQNMAMTNELAGGLRDMGFKVIMDGFDGDYISVNMLENIHVDALKLDLRFMKGSDDNTIEAIIEQARRLNIELMASGIENSQQVSLLRKTGCEIGQGYYFHKPMSIEAYEEMMA